MSVGNSLLHLIMLLALGATVATLLKALWAGSETERSAHARSAWQLAPLPVMLWFLLAAWAHGGRRDAGVAAAVWFAGWALLAVLSRAHARGAAPALIALWVLAGIGLALQADLAPSMRRAWLREQTLLSLVLAGAVVVAPRGREWIVSWLGGRDWRPTVIRLALALAGLAVLAVFIPALRTGIWALCMLAYLLGVAVVAARTAEQEWKPVTVPTWFEAWRPALVMAAAPTVALLLLVPGRKEPDFSPALVLTVVLLVTFLVTRQRGAAVALFLAASVTVLVAYQVQKPRRLVQRIEGVLRPEDAASDQQMQALWGLARGGIFGRGVGCYVLVDGRSAAGRVAAAGRAPRPALALTETDAVWGLVNETTGACGTVAVLLLAAVVAVWLWQGATRSRDLTARCWFAAVTTAWTLCHLWTLGWTVGRWPIMGLACPLLSGGIYNMLLWSAVLGGSFGLAGIPMGSPASPDPPADPPHPLRPVALGALGLALWILSGVWLFGIQAPEATLQRVFQGRQAEAAAWKAVHTGQIAVRHGRLEIVAARLPADARRRKQARARYEQWIGQRAIFIVRGGRVSVDSFAFRQAEPTGLGAVLRLVRS